jgi:putative redox protein
MSIPGVLTLKSIDAGLEFAARFPFSHMHFDSRPGEREVSPVEGLLASLAACEAMDVIEILRKKRQVVTGYEVHMSGERRADPPKRYTSITLNHRVTGRGVSLIAVQEAVRLSDEKYCTVRHSLASDLAVTHVIEIVEG